MDRKELRCNFSAEDWTDIDKLKDLTGLKNQSELIRFAVRYTKNNLSGAAV